MTSYVDTDEDIDTGFDITKLTTEIMECITDAENCPYEIIEDRGVAIHKAIMECRKPTVILILGKGNETRDRYGTMFMHRPSDSEYVKMYMPFYDEAPFHALEIPGNGTQTPEEYYK